MSRQWPESLFKPFRAIILDWTIVFHDAEKEKVLIAALTQVLMRGTYCAIIADDFINLENRLLNAFPLAARKFLTYANAESIRWVFNQILVPAGIAPENIIILNYKIEPHIKKIHFAELEHSTLISMRADAAIEFMEAQAHLLDFEKTFPPPSWSLIQEGFDPARESEMETLFTQGNGKLCVRGTMSLPIPSEEGDLMIGGLYDRNLFSEGQVELISARANALSELVAFPFPFRIELEVAGRPLSSASQDFRAYERCLDFRDGCLRENFHFEDTRGYRTAITFKRWVLFHNRSLLLQEIEVNAINHSELIVLRFPFDAPDLSINHPHLELVSSSVGGQPCQSILYKCAFSDTEVAFASRIKSLEEELNHPVLAIAGRPGENTLVRRIIALKTNEKKTELSPLREVQAELRQIPFDSFDSTISAHKARWAVFWSRANAEFPRSPETAQAWRFNVYHLRIAADGDPKASVGARALNGRAYDGHIFWDTEIFMFPFYLYTVPSIAKNLLEYRYRTLPAARQRAREMGFSGACFPWESAATGEDVTPTKIFLRDSGTEIPVLTGKQQIHVTAAIAHAVSKYWDATLDREFMLNQGLELLAETARFWISRANKKNGELHLNAVIGPDEFHQNINNNRYTNTMAAFNLKIAAELFEHFAQEADDRWLALTQKLALIPGEIKVWRAGADSLLTPPAREDHVFEQFQGFFNLHDPLENIELGRNAEERLLQAPLDRLLRWQEINKEQTIKQADILMIPFLFPDLFTPAEIRANYIYYERRTDHGSSLSPCVHAAIAARAGFKEDAIFFWRKALNMDLTNVMGNSALGSHAACMGGAWQTLVFHFLGVRFEDGTPVIDEDAAFRLPPECEGVKLQLLYRGQQYTIAVPRQEERKAA